MKRHIALLVFLELVDVLMFIAFIYELDLVFVFVGFVVMCIFVHEFKQRSLSMTDIRDDFEKWYRDSFPKYNLYSKYDQFKEVQATTFQAATLAQQAKIEALEIQVQDG